ncbi:Zn-dependent alcohol dehydrogenase [Marinactinospora thermotolerans]|uniref:S-(Hydroxymethyl)glutathione dehydrogenase / alcohol dehydrogenase n=1 Tax=Marinactinospora thermotolerans DSM 45154 TaxID=1122192 RepID=A0A1T4NC22_9ACTN|nr:Zn-dependent alcohol dehydrogenase [Marinactinospora thermotolerans]SJZ76830.1 S-(hydroxymethyl)glutathione dehydrogenase / alcohol dehydrogenase [Marinactinospora thermotolerans DSM 45154]
MPTTVEAAVFSEIGAPPRIGEILLPDPGPGRVKVRLAAAGVCHSDLSLAEGRLAQPFPAVLGHEGAGTVIAVGPDVTDVQVGQRVVLNWAPPCRSCWFCHNGEPYLCERSGDAAHSPYASLPDGTALHAGLGTAAFAQETVVPTSAVVPLPDGIQPHNAALLGCAVLTGVGAVTNSARVRPGQSVAVIGLGGVGLAVLQGARLAGADPIIAVDVSPAKEELATRLGATHFRLAGDGLSREIRGLTGGRGVDHAFEVVGSAAAIRQAWSATRRGGSTTVVGVGAKDDRLSFNALELFHFARTLRGCVYGSADPATDIPELARHVHDGAIDLAAMVTDEITLAELPDAFHRMLEGKGGRSLIRFE